MVDYPWRVSYHLLKSLTHVFLTQLIHSWLVQYTSFGYINSFGVYEDFYVREYLSSFTPSDIG